MGLTEHQAKQLHAARIHSSQRESQVRAALGVKGGLKYLLPKFAITIPEGENTSLFLENYGSMDWEMDCQGCGNKSETSFCKGKLMCPSCIISAKCVDGP